MLIRSPCRGFRLRGPNASPVEAAAPEPSPAARPLAERGRSLLQWHPAADQQGQGPRAPVGWCVRGARLPSEFGRLAGAQCSTGVLCMPGSRPCLPWLKPTGLLAPCSSVTAAFASRAPGGHLAMTARAARTGVAGHRHVRRPLAAPSRGLRGPAAPLHTKYSPARAASRS